MKIIIVAGIVLLATSALAESQNFVPPGHHYEHGQGQPANNTAIAGATATAISTNTNINANMNTNRNVNINRQGQIQQQTAIGGQGGSATIPQTININAGGATLNPLPNAQAGATGQNISVDARTTVGGQSVNIITPQNQSQTPVVIDAGNATGQMNYPVPFAASAPPMASPGIDAGMAARGEPGIPKAYNLVASLWDDNTTWAPNQIKTEIPAGVLVKGRQIYSAPTNKGRGDGVLTIHKSKPRARAYLRIYTGTAIATEKGVMLTDLEDAAMMTAVKMGGTGIVIGTVHYYTRNTTRGGGIGAGLAANILGSLAGAATSWGPNIGGTYQSWLSDSDAYPFMSFDVIVDR